jgi:hypothetical protein
MPPATVKDEAASSAHDMRDQAQAARDTEPIAVSDPPMNLQVIASPQGDILWVSGALHHV